MWALTAKDFTRKTIGCAAVGEKAIKTLKYKQFEKMEHGFPYDWTFVYSTPGKVVIKWNIVEVNFQKPTRHVIVIKRGRATSCFTYESNAEAAKKIREDHNNGIGIMRWWFIYESYEDSSEDYIRWIEYIHPHM